ncbi:MAG: hypothetical protein FJ147_03760 [Deltaproteobacteria bacterium]|nr:hypothetical protein [Deltaproteobacteria bacterium]
MSLKIYLDDCAYDKALVRVLRQAGWDVVTPFDAGVAGHSDEVHLQYAMSQGLVLVTKNPRDFEELHGQYPQHPGILAIYQDNDPTKDMSVGDIVQAIRNVIAAGVLIAGQFISLNAWRYGRREQQ